jgi:hypothetical protein
MSAFIALQVAAKYIVLKSIIKSKRFIGKNAVTKVKDTVSVTNMPEISKKVCNNLEISSSRKFSGIAFFQHLASHFLIVISARLEPQTSNTVTSLINQRKSTELSVSSLKMKSTYAESTFNLTMKYFSKWEMVIGIFRSLVQERSRLRFQMTKN